MRLIEATIPAGRADAIADAVRRAAPPDWRLGPTEQGLRQLRILVRKEEAQKLVDTLQGLLGGVEGWRMVILPVEATLPAIKAVAAPASTGDGRRSNAMALREEIYQDVAGGAAVNANFVVLTMLSVVVAAIGMQTDSIAVVIGAMVIAPLLGPILAFSFGSALGDLDLMLRAARTAITGVSVGFITSIVIGVVAPVRLDSGELAERTRVALDAVALALAAGAAAALSTLTGISSALVGVMVAVALVPPAVAAGLLLGAGQLGQAASAALLLAVNVVCVNLAAQLIFAFRGVRPRTWLEQRSARRSLRVNVAVWIVLLALLVALIHITAAYTDASMGAVG